MRLKLVWLALAAALFGIYPVRAITGDKPEFRKLAEGVYVYIGKLNDANAMAIVTSQGVIVIDSGNNNRTRALFSRTSSPSQISRFALW